MFNFGLTNKALTDMNVSDSEFRTLYLIANNCSMNNTQSIEMYNAFLMEKLHYSESTIKRCIKVLEEMGYISGFIEYIASKNLLYNAWRFMDEDNFPPYPQHIKDMKAYGYILGRLSQIS